MKKQLLSLLFGLFVMASFGAYNGYSKNNNAVTTACFSSSSKPYPAPIPWKEGFEWISKVDEIPSDMFFTRTSDRTFMAEGVQRKSHLGAKYAQFSNVRGSEWIISPGFQLKAGNTYRFSFWYMGTTDTLQVKTGYGQNSNALTITVGLPVLNLKGVPYREYSIYFTPEKDSLYYFGINNVKTTFATGTENGVSIDDLALDYALACPEPTFFSAVGVPGDDYVNLSWISSASNFEVEYRLNEEDAQWVSEAGITTTNYRLEGLDPANSYEIHARTACAGNTYSIWSSSVFATTTDLKPAALPFKEYFTKGISDKEWVSVNNGQATKWFVDTAFNRIPGSNGAVAYVSKDNGVKNEYAKGNVSHFYRDVKFSDADGFRFSFKWRARGANTGFAVTPHILQVAIINPGTSIPTTTGFDLEYLWGSNRFQLPTTPIWVKEEIALPGSFSEQTQRIVFTWNATPANNAFNPGAAIDSVEIFSVNCGTPANFKLAELQGTNSMKLSWYGNPRPGTFEIAYKKLGETNWESSKFTTQSTYVLDNLQAATPYEIQIRKICGVNDTSLWSDIITEATTQVLAQLPFEETFETAESNKWTTVNGTQTNKWYIDTAAHTGTTGHALYISGDGGLANTSQTGAANISTVYAYRDIEFTQATTENYLFSFDWKATGLSSSGHYIRIYLTDYDSIPTAGFLWDKTLTAIPSFVKEISAISANWTNEEILLPADVYSGKKKRLVFLWRNASNVPITTAPAIDNVRIKATNCKTPEDFSIAGNPSTTSLLLGYTTQSTQLQLECSTCATAYQTISAGGGKYELTGLSAGATYSLRLRNLCSNDTSGWTSAISGKTFSGAFTTLPFNENFEDSAAVMSAWTIAQNASNNNAANWQTGGESYEPTNGTKGLYIDRRGNATNTLDKPTGASSAHAYKVMEFPASDNGYLLTFQWKGGGDAVSNLQVFLADPVLGIATANYPTDNSKNPEPLNNLVFKGKYSNATDWQTVRVAIPPFNTKMLKQLTLTWRNVASSNPNAPTYPGLGASIDNISIAELTCPLPQNVQANPAATTINLSWTAPGQTNFIVKYIDELGNTTETPVTGATTTLSGLRANTGYKIWVRSNCVDVYWSDSVYVRTPQNFAALDYDEHFGNSTTDWAFENGSQANKWAVGIPSSTTEPKLYITNNGSNKTYSPAQQSITHVYRDVFFKTAQEYSLNFDFNWINEGVSDENAYMALSVVDTNYSPASGTTIPANKALFNTKIPVAPSLQKYSTTLPATYSGTVKRLVFTWYNNVGAFSEKPAPSVDNFSVRVLDCKVPVNLDVVDHKQQNALVLNWQSEGSNFVVSYRKSGETIWTETSQTTNRPYTLSGLEYNTDYEVRARQVCTGNIAWSQSVQARTMQEPGNLEYTENFETATGVPGKWTMVNGGETNKWFIGQEASAPGGVGDVASAYIDYLSGSANNYNTSTSSVSHIYRDIAFNPAVEYELSFDWKCQGNITDFVRVFLVNPDYLPAAGTMLPSSAIISEVDIHTTDDQWHSQSIALPGVPEESMKRLVFTWHNNAANPQTYPGAAIDNIKIKTYNCHRPEALSLIGFPSKDTIAFGWNVADGELFDIQCRDITIGQSNWEDTAQAISDKNFVLRNLETHHQYEIRVLNHCNVGSSTWSEPFAAITMQEPLPLPLSEDFSGNVVQRWTFENGNKTNRWVTGALGAAYISNNGHNNIYNPDVASIVHLYKDLETPLQKQFMLTYDWRCGGEGNFDYMQVYLANLTDVPVAGQLMPTATRLHNSPMSKGDSLWRQDTILFSDTLSLQSKRLVFSWINNDRDGRKFPAAIKNIQFIALGCKTPTNLKVVAFPNPNTAVLGWDSVGLIYAVSYKKKAEINWTEIGSLASNTITITSLTPDTEYEFRVKNTCDESALWTLPLQKRTPQNPTILPFEENFAKPNSNLWTMLQTGSINKWHIDTATYTAGDRKSLYISNNRGDSNRFDDSQVSIVHTYRDITFTDPSITSPAEFEISFDWKCLGMHLITDNVDYAYMQAYLVDKEYPLTEGKLIDAKYKLFARNFRDSIIEWKNIQVLLPDTLAGKTKRLVFTWYNDLYTKNGNPPIAIDNLNVYAYPCKAPVNIVVENSFSLDRKVRWDSPESNFVVNSKAHDDEREVETNLHQAIVANLMPNKNYSMSVKAICQSGGESAYSAGVPTGTFCPANALPFFESGFYALSIESTEAAGCWSEYRGYLPFDGTIAPTSNFSNAGANIRKWKNARVSSDTVANIDLVGGSINHWLMTPPLNLGNKKTALEFDLAHTASIVTPADAQFAVLISNTGDWTIADTLALWENTADRKNIDAISMNGQTIYIPLTKYSGVVRIAFYAKSPSFVSGGFNNIAIDDISVYEVTCDAEDINFANITNTSVTANWKPQPHRNKWQLRYALQSTPNNFIKDTLVIDAHSVTFSNLAYNTEYNLEMRAICSEGDTGAWKRTLMQTLAPCQSIAKVDTAASQIHFSKANISWVVNGTRKGYELLYGLASERFENLKPISTTDTFAILPNLLPQTRQIVYIRAICSNDDRSAWTQYIFNTPKRGCDTVTNIRTVETFTTGATIAWDAVPEQEKWLVQYGSSGIGTMLFRQSLHKQYTITGVDAGTTINYYVRAICPNGDTSDLGQINTFIAKTCMPVTNVQVTYPATEENKALVTWNTQVKQGQWEVIIRASNTAVPNVRRSDDTSYLLDMSGFVQGVTYTVEVRANCINSQSTPSQPITLSFVGMDKKLLPDNVHIVLSPNPAKEYVNLKLEGVEGNIELSITTVNGELVKEETFRTNPNTAKQISLQGLAKGTYYVRILHKDWVTVEKLIVN